MSSSTTNQVKLPRVAITFCTQCRWMLRAAYFGQELLSTFGATIGEVALIPASGGLFQVNLSYDKAVLGDDQDETQLTHVLIWDRKTEGGFPETKVLKQLIRNHIDPQKDLGHSDAAAKSMKPGREAVIKDPSTQEAQVTLPLPSETSETEKSSCTDCA